MLKTYRVAPASITCTFTADSAKAQLCLAGPDGDTFELGLLKSKKLLVWLMSNGSEVRCEQSHDTP